MEKQQLTINWTKVSKYVFWLILISFAIAGTQLPLFCIWWTSKVDFPHSTEWAMIQLFSSITSIIVIACGFALKHAIKDDEDFNRKQTWLSKCIYLLIFGLIYNIQLTIKFKDQKDEEAVGLKNLSWDQIYDEYGNRFESKDEFDQAVDNYYSFWFKLTLLILMVVQIALALKLATIKEIGKTVFYVLNFTFFIFGVIFIITGVYAWYFREQYYLQDIYPMSFIYVLFVIGILITFLAFVGYLTFAWTLQRTIKAYIVLTFLISATFLGLYIYFEAENTDITGYIKSHCVGILTIIPEDKFSNFNCPYKYTEKNVDTQALKCQKERVSWVWEEQDMNRAGCLNVECCGEAVSQLEEIAFDAKFFPLFAFVLTLIAFIVANKINSEGIQLHKESSFAKCFSFLLFLALATMIGTTGYIASQKVLTRNFIESKMVGVQLHPQFRLEQTKQGCFDIKEYISKIKAEIPQNEIAFLSTQDGFFLNSTNVQYKTMSYDQKNDKNQLICSACPGQNLDLQLTFINTTINENIGFTDQKQTITGRVLDVNMNGLSDVSIQSTYQSCQQFTTKTDSDGQFSLTLPMWSIWTPYQVQLTFMKEGWLQETFVYTVGGLPLTLSKSIGQVFLGQSEEQGLQDQKDVPFQLSQCPLVYSKLIEDKLYFTTVLSNDKVNSQPHLIKKDTTTVLNLWSPRIDMDSELVLVLQWPNYGSQTVDLDLWIEFQMDEKETCTVSFLSKACGGTSILTQSKTIGLDVARIILGPYVYKIYVKQYGHEDTQLDNVQLLIYEKHSKYPIATFQKPDTKGAVWSVLCIHGSVENLSYIDITGDRQDFSGCSEKLQEVSGIIQKIGQV